MTYKKPDPIPEQIHVVLDEVIEEKERFIGRLWPELNAGNDDLEYDIARASTDIEVLKFIKSKFVES